jgi:hypothetical protein
MDPLAEITKAVDAMDNTPTVILTGQPGMGKTHQMALDVAMAGLRVHPDTFYTMRGLTLPNYEILYNEPLWSYDNVYRYGLDDKPKVGDRKVNQKRKVKDRARNRAARQTRRSQR